MLHPLDEFTHHSIYAQPRYDREYCALKFNEFRHLYGAKKTLAALNHMRYLGTFPSGGAWFKNHRNKNRT